MADNKILEGILQDYKKYTKASNLYEAGSAFVTRIADFWRNDKEVFGDIYERDKIYKSRITVSRSDIVSFSCNCHEFTKDKTICHHIGALYLAYTGKYTNEDKLIYTSLETRKIVNEYLKKKHNESKILDNTGIQLEVNLEIRNNNIVLTYEVIIRDKVYRIKNIFDFIARIKEMEYYEYGKNYGFVHSLEAFTEKSREHVEYILSIVRMEERLCKIADISSVLIEDNHRIVLCGREVDNYIERFKNSKLMLDSKRHTIVYNNPEIYIKIISEGNSGYVVFMDNIKGYIEGAEKLYICDSKHIYVPDNDYIDKMSIFIKYICEDKQMKLLINQKDMSSFCNGVLPELMECCVVDMPDDLLIKYKPWELHNEFTVKALKDNVHVIILSKYRDGIFDLYTGVCSDKNVCRDYSKEYAIKTIFERYKAYRLSTGELRISGYDNIYEFLVSGIKELSDYGVVNYDTKLNELKLVNTYEFTANVSVKENWLDLKIDTSGYTEKELANVINAYKQKEKYVAINDNTIVKLDDNGFELLASLAYDLDFSAADIFSKSIFIPRYRVMYIDSMLSVNGVSYDSDEQYNNLLNCIKNIEDSEMDEPFEVKNILRDYQRIGYKWLKTMDMCGFGGILADDMGLGKTLQVLALLADEYKDNSIEHKKTLIVVPSSLIYNWENEVEKFVPSLRVAAVVGAKSERINIIENSNADILITSYELLKRDVEEYLKINFRYEILDEAQNIKNYTTANAKAVKKIQAETKFALTGTPIENRLSELWSIFDYVMPGFLYSNKRFKDKFEIPIVKEEAAEIQSSFKRIISPFILRRDKKEVLKELPDKLEYNLYAKMEGEQHKLYTANAYKLKEELENKDNSYYISNKIKFLAEITRLRQICCDPSLCYEDYEDESYKLNMCIDLIKTSTEGGHKILVFSQFTSMLQIIAKRLLDENISFYTLTGKTSVDERISLVNRFNKDNTEVFLMSLKVGGTGLNLTGADVVIHYDPWWNMAVQNQATDRVHRIGQDKVVSVYKLIAKDSIEENIYNLQLAKEKLSKDIVTGNNITLSGLSKEELLSILIG